MNHSAIGGLTLMDTQVSILDTRRKINAWKVSFGKTYRLYYTEYHAEQLARALKLNGTECAITQVVLTNGRAR